MAGKLNPPVPGHLRVHNVGRVVRRVSDARQPTSRQVATTIVLPTLTLPN